MEKRSETLKNMVSDAIDVSLFFSVIYGYIVYLLFFTTVHVNCVAIVWVP